jgi:hypothetical protein
VWDGQREREVELRTAIKLCGKNLNEHGGPKLAEQQVHWALHVLGRLCTLFDVIRVFMVHFADVIFPFVMLIKAQTVYETNRSNEKTARHDFIQTLVLDLCSLGHIRYSNPAD